MTDEQITQLENVVERLRVQLAGCSVAAGQNTEKSRKERATPDQWGWSPAYQDVCDAVDREIALRDENARLRTLVARGGERVKEWVNPLDADELFRDCKEEMERWQ